MLNGILALIFLWCARRVVWRVVKFVLAASVITILVPAIAIAYGLLHFGIIG